MQAPGPARPAARAAAAGRMARFAVVGGTGALVNQAGLMALHGGLGLPLWIASPIAIEASIASNFALNSTWTWGERPARPLRAWLRQAARYHAATAASALLGNVGVLLALVHLFALDYRIANLLGIGAGALANFAAAELWVFRRAPRRPPG